MRLIGIMDLAVFGIGGFWVWHAFGLSPEQGVAVVTLAWAIKPSIFGGD